MAEGKDGEKGRNGAWGREGGRDRVTGRGGGGSGGAIPLSTMHSGPVVSVTAHTP